MESITHDDPEKTVCVLLSTESDDSTRRWWPFEFRLEYRITVGARLRLELSMKNCGDSALRFEEALHTYFRVGDVERARVRGLDGVMYLDNRDGNREKMQSADVSISRQIDNAYGNATGVVQVHDPVLGRTLITEKQGSASTIVWNPWSDGSAAMADLRNDEWREMLCVEGANILSSAVALQPEESHLMAITIGAADHP